MLHKLSGILFLTLISCGAGSGQTPFHGLTAGKSTRTDVERVLGKPVKQYSETLSEYRPTVDARREESKVYIRYRKGSTIVERIEAMSSQPLRRSDVLAALRLPQKPIAAQTDTNGRLFEYYGGQFCVALTYDGPDVSNGVSRIARYSPELFANSVIGIRSGSGTASSNDSISGRWSGSWTNSKEESGSSTINVSQKGFVITGDEDGWAIENGYRSGNLLTWQYRNQNNGCTDYSVRLVISADGRTANGTYKAFDHCEKRPYTGDYINYHRE